MAEKDNGVQAKIKKIYPNAAFVHCSSHWPSLVVNDLSAVPSVCNSIGTIKSTIGFFHESIKRRSLFPNIPFLSETRLTSKYKSIRMFSDKFEDINTQKYCQRWKLQIHDSLHLSCCLHPVRLLFNFAWLLFPFTQLFLNQSSRHFKQFNLAFCKCRSTFTTCFW